VDLDVDDRGGSVPKLVEAAGCKVWSVYHKELGRAQLEVAHSLGLKVLVWTVNRTSDMQNFIKLGVDGIVTDYPDKLHRVLREMGAPVPPPTPGDEHS
jgi:glycerophosphoryl diester phosphodiesterase